jgi:outer membrane protein TolC
MKIKIFNLLLLLLSATSFVNGQSLEFYIEKALKNSPLLKDFQNQILSGKADSMLVRAGYKTQINNVSQVMYAPYSTRYGYDEAITNGANYSSVISLVQSLFNKKTKANQFNELSLSKKSVEAEIKISETDLREGITSQYLTAFSDLQQVQFNQGILDQLRNEQELVNSLVGKGIYQQTDAMSLSVTITAQKIAIRQADLQYHNNLAILNFMCGITDTATVILQKPELRVNNNFDISTTPSMLKFSLDSLKTLNERQAVDLNYRPKVSAFADAGFMSILPQNIPHNFGTSFGVNFTVPIYDGNQRKIQYEKLQLTENTRLGYRSYYSAQYRLRQKQLTDQLRLTDDLIKNIREQLSEQEQLLSLYKIEIEKGLVRFIDFLDIINSYSQAKNNLTQAEMGRLQIINQMNYLK